jgi:hypothetical protein
MHYKKLLMLSALAGCSVFGGLTLHAQDKATLDLLVKKGLITQDEADSVAKPSVAAVVTSKVATVQKIRLEGLIQFSYDWITPEDQTPNKTQNATSVNQMYFRRSQIGMIADLGNGWSGELMVDFSADQIDDQPKAGLSLQSTPVTQSIGQIGASPTQYISQAMFEREDIKKTFEDLGTLEAGYDKVTFIREENTPSGELPTIERSPLTRYFDEYYGSPNAFRLAFAQRHTGLFWSGNVEQLPGLYYSAALVNGIQSNINYFQVNGLNSFGGFLGTGYKGKMGPVSYDTGINAGYTGDGNSDSTSVNGKFYTTSALTTNTGAPLFAAGSLATGTEHVDQRNSTYGYNPYIEVSYDKFTLKTEFVQGYFTNGRSTIPIVSTSVVQPGVTSAAMPWGAQFTGIYHATPTVDVVSRYAYLSTNGRGTNVADVIWNGANDPSSTTLYDDVWSAYIGVNWSIIPHSLILSGGYEYAQFTGRNVTPTSEGGNGLTNSNVNIPSTWSGPRTDVNIIRARLSVLF